MTPAGLELVEAAKASGEWKAAYRLADDHEIPDVLERALRENETAWLNFQRFSNTDKHAFIALSRRRRRRRRDGDESSGRSS